MLDPQKALFECNGTPLLRYESQNSANLYSVVVVCLFVDTNISLLAKIVD